MSRCTYTEDVARQMRQQRNLPTANLSLATPADQQLAEGYLSTIGLQAPPTAPTPPDASGGDFGDGRR